MELSSDPMNNTKTEMLETDEQFKDVLKALQYINDPLNDLASSPSAVVYYRTPCCDMRCCFPTCGGSDKCCDSTYKYNTLVKVGGGKKYLFSNFATLSCVGCMENRFEKCTSYTYSNYEEYSSNKGLPYCEMVVEPGCRFCRCCSLFLNVFIRNQNQNNLIGNVEFRGKCKECCSCDDTRNTWCGCCGDKENFCYDFFYCCEILSPEKKVIYFIYLRLCCIQCYPYECCDKVEFSIKADGGKKVGNIMGIRNCCYCYGICGTKFSYTIDFPADCTPELKLTIINAVIAIDLLLL